LCACRAKMPVIGHGPEINYLIVVNRKTPRPTAGSEQKLFVGEDISIVIDHPFFIRKDLLDHAIKMKLRSFAFCLAPNAVQRVALPQSLREGRTIVRSIGFRANDTDSTSGVSFADAIRGGGRGHSAADNQVLIVRHA